MYDNCSLLACLHTIFKNLLVSSACYGKQGSNQRQNLSCSEEEMMGGKRRGLVVTDKLSHSMLIRWWHQSINQSYILGFFQYTARRLSKQSKDKHVCFLNDPGFLLQVPFCKVTIHVVNTCFTVKVMNTLMEEKMPTAMTTAKYPMMTA